MNYKKPQRIFEEEGLVIPERSYHVEIENIRNTKNQDIKTMVDQGRYFSIFAPRQSGKTTFFRDFCHRLEKDPTYITILLSFESYSNLDNSARFYQSLETEFRTQLIDRLTMVKCHQLGAVSEFLDSHKLTDNISFGELFEGLNRIIQFKKIVIFIDEFDGIPFQELENFLTILRKLYQQHKQKTNKALYSIGLVGIRNITKLVVGGISPFNIADEVSLLPFSLKNIQDLYSQYTQETNQPFTDKAIEKIYEITAGQPWLVNRLGSILTVVVKPGIIEAITDQDVEHAKELLLREHNKHFDNLWEKLEGYEEIFITIANKGVLYHPYDKDQSWLRQFGLIKEDEGKAVAANLIYKKQFLSLLQKNMEFSVFSPSNANSGSPNEVFVSYAWGGESEDLVNQLEKAFQEKGITLVRDKRDLGFKGKIRDFMKKIGKGKCVVVVIGKKYLESENCMFELIQIAQNKSFYDRVFPIILEDARINKSSTRIKYVKYWEKEIQVLDKEMKEVSSANLHGFREDIDRLQEIRSTIAEITNLLRDMNTLTPEIHKKNGFKEILQAIER